MQKDKTNGFDDMLRRSMDGAPSRLPADMLDRILEKNKRKRRAMFWWLNFAVGVYAIVLAVYIFGNTAKSGGPIVAESKTISQSQLDNNVGERHYTDKSSTHVNKIADALASSNSAEITPTERGGTTDIQDNTGATDRSGTEDPVMEDGLEPVQENPIQGEKVDDIPLPIVVTDVMPTEPAISNSDSANSEEQNPIIANVARADSTTPPSTIPPAANNNSGKGKKLFGNLHWDPFVSIGWMNEQQKLGVREFNEGTTHRDLPGMLSEATRPANGFQLNFGLGTSIGERFSFKGGIQYANMSNRIETEYFVHDVPVIDQDGTIKGYIELPDTFKRTVYISHSFKTSVISMPLQFSYVQKIGSSNELHFGLGIRPQIHLVHNWTIPDKINVVSLKWTDIKSVLSTPATVNMGYFRKANQFTFGVQARINPLYAVPRNLGGNITLQTRQNEFGLVVMYDLNTPKK
jgi:hypothetical protein